MQQDPDTLDMVQFGALALLNARLAGKNQAWVLLPNQRTCYWLHIIFFWVARAVYLVSQMNENHTRTFLYTAWYGTPRAGR